MSSTMVYLDNNASTRLDPAVVEEMMPFLTELYGNPSSGYQFAAQARKAIEQARERTAQLLECEPEEVVFTSCGTESNNAAINSAVQFEPLGKHVVTSAVEHSAVLRPFQELQKRGAEVTFVPVDQNGAVDLAGLEKAIRPDTALVSIMWANNETGVLFPAEKIAKICREKRVLFHTDAVQAAGKIPMRLRDSAINFVSVSAHKFHGPKGVGVLYINKRSRFHSSIIGGSHESGRRAGTENVASIVGLGKAAERARECLGEEATQVRAMRDRFEKGVLEKIPGASVNGAGADRLPNTSNIFFEGIESQAALMLLDRHQVCCSAGSACKTGSGEGSHVLRSMHGSDERGRGSMRFSFGRFNSEADVDKALEIIPQAIAKLRRLNSPVAPQTVGAATL
jgi:cysteine desulfurase